MAGQNVSTLLRQIKSFHCGKILFSTGAGIIVSLYLWVLKETKRMNQKIK
jgi:hypothetical protein